MLKGKERDYATTVAEKGISRGSLIIRRPGEKGETRIMGNPRGKEKVKGPGRVGTVTSTITKAEIVQSLQKKAKAKGTIHTAMEIGRNQE